MPNIDKGLTQKEAEMRLQKYGSNVLPEKKPPSNLKIFLSQLKNPLVYVLIFAGTTTLFLGHFSDSIIIFAAILINSTLGFFQEKKANNALSALNKLVTSETDIIRDNKRFKVDTKNIVPGDFVILNQGSKVPADGKVVKANRLFMDEAIITGESLSVPKKDGESIYMGTIVTSGQCIAIIETTGKQTRMGKIALEVQSPQEDTPLKKQLSKFSQGLVFLILFLTAFVFIIGLFTKRDLGTMFTTSVALAVSAIPEGLLVGLTVILAIGMQRILKRKGLVRNLVSAETLGSVTTICLDKTGTLTEGKMRVVEVLGNEKDIALQGHLANDLDDPLVIAVEKWAVNKLGKKQATETQKKYLRLDNVPFSPKNRFSASLHLWNTNNNMLFVNGAPDILINKCEFSLSEKEKVLSEIENLTKKGNRLMGMIRKRVPLNKKGVVQKDLNDSYEWVGLIAFSDPVRNGVKNALEKTRAAGIKLIVITGDYPQTAVSVMNELGLVIDKKMIILGDMLENMTEPDLSRFLKDNIDVKLFARTTPHQKLKIVNALRKNGEVVAMMGDGVNDAPALSKSDIGIVVGEATDVAKESADLVLLDSKFDTVVSAIEEGRGIFDNIRKVIMYLMSTAFNEITAVVGAIMMGLPLPVSAAQILWINIVSDGFPDLALTVEPKRRGIMLESPRSSREPLVAKWMKVLIGIISITSGIIALTIFTFIFLKTGDEKLAQSAGFVALGINSLVYVFSIRTLKDPFWKEGLFENKWLLGAVFIGAILQLFPFWTESTRNFFGVAPMPGKYWVSILVSSFAMFAAIEVFKLGFKFRENS